MFPYRSTGMGAQTLAPKSLLRNLKILLEKKYEISNSLCIDKDRVLYETAAHLTGVLFLVEKELSLKCN